jgi:hypothetical protein
MIGFGPITVINLCPKGYSIYTVEVKRVNMRCFVESNIRPNQVMSQATYVVIVNASLSSSNVHFVSLGL